MNIWEPDTAAESPPLTRDHLASWEQRTGFRIPPMLGSALLIQNGGKVANTAQPEISILPLEAWQPVEADLLEIAGYTGDHRELIAFADVEYGGVYFLNFARLTPAGEPVIGSLAHDSFDFEEGTSSTMEFLTQIAATDQHPATAAQKAASLTRLGEFRLAHDEYVTHTLVGRDPEGLLIAVNYFTRPDKEEWSAHLLPEPMKRHTMKITPKEFYGIAGYALHLEPGDREGIIQWSSTRLASGLWKNHVGKTAPIYATLYNQEVEPLIQFQQTLAGPAPSPVYAEAESLRWEYLRQFATLSGAEKMKAEACLSRVEYGIPTDTLFQDTAPDSKTVATGSPGEIDITAMIQMMLQGSPVESRSQGATLSPEFRQLIDRMVAAENAVKEERWRS